MTAWFAVIMPIVAIASLHIAVYGLRETVKVVLLFAILITATGLLLTLTEYLETLT